MQTTAPWASPILGGKNPTTVGFPSRYCREEVLAEAEAQHVAAKRHGRTAA